MLAAIVEDWNQANEYRFASEILRDMARDFHPVGRDAGIDQSLGKIRVELEGLNESLDPDVVSLPETAEELYVRLDEFVIVRSSVEGRVEDNERIELERAESNG
ncbi:uncharacterized protein RCC_10856 [Ramularia collo-cygni]|uniref:Uncharacterized protein n=1 Tax=Ramularia collo-cygni TaxID=112498 RepID=A0A2D3V4A6_9PEZI|nr:uncharacterized protein RCC_10856 [Ramularia collo-cygni]CZT25127.1 uncharacterized protein RCC_10856 [Ramularia collo-cygni]